MVGNTHRRGDKFMPAAMKCVTRRKGRQVQARRSDHARDPLDLKWPMCQRRNSRHPKESHHARHVDLSRTLSAKLVSPYPRTN